MVSVFATKFLYFPVLIPTPYRLIGYACKFADYSSNILFVPDRKWDNLNALQSHNSIKINTLGQFISILINSRIQIQGFEIL